MAKKVLVVEDNLLNLKLFCDLLRAHGYEARPISDGREAVAAARAFGPQLIIMDIQLPHVSGLELIGEIKGDEALKPIPVMAVTAYAASGDEDRIRAAGAEAYVSKPISVLRFVEEVQALVGSAEEVAADPEPEAEKAPAGPGADEPDAAGDGNPDDRIGGSTEAADGPPQGEDETLERDS